MTIAPPWPLKACIGPRRRSYERPPGHSLRRTAERTPASAPGIRWSADGRAPRPGVRWEVSSTGRWPSRLLR